MKQDERLPMGTKFNSCFGFVDLPSQILEAAIFDDHIQFDCEDGIYKQYLCSHEDGTEFIKVQKVRCK